MSAQRKPYPAYRDSGVPWLGNVPAHWQQLPGRACFTEKKALNVGMRETTVLSLSYGRIVVKPPEKLHGLVPASFETYQTIEPYDIVIRPTDLQNDWVSLRTGLAKTRGIITSAYMRLRTTGLLDPEYGRLLLHAYDLKKVFYGLGSGLRQNLSWRDFKYLPCLVPPPDEQRAIARFLDHYDRLIRRYIRAQRRLIGLLEEQKQALIQRAVTRGLDPDVPLKDSGIEWMGEIPEHWKAMRLKNVVREIIDTEHKTAPFYEDGQYLVVRTSNIKNGKLMLDDAKYTDEDGFQEWTRRGVPEQGDIIFTREAPAGEACLVPSDIPLCLGQRTVLFRVDRSQLDPRFGLFSIYGGAAAQFIQLLSFGSTVAHFNMSDIACIPMMLPPLEEQRAIADFVNYHSHQIDIEIDRIQRQINLIREYRTRLIADVVTGKLDVRGVPLPDLDAGDEPNTEEANV